MKLLVTMAGKGSRFKDVGVTVPKHEIPVRDKPMFDWAMRSLEAFYDEEFIFVTHSDHDAEDFLTDSCERLGISTYREIVLDEYTSGQAATALAADDVLSDSESVAIYNIDTYIEPGELSPGEISGAGFIPYFEAPGERWSFVRVGGDDWVTEVSEKEKISDRATVGFYYFDRWSYFVEAYEAAATYVETEYGEQYVAPFYNHLINNDYLIASTQIDRDAIHVLGTPKDLREFDPDFDPAAIG